MSRPGPPCVPPRVRHHGAGAGAGPDGSGRSRPRRGRPARGGGPRRAAPESRVTRAGAGLHRERFRRVLFLHLAFFTSRGGSEFIPDAKGARRCGEKAEKG
ncbi:hypothetical protein GCM10027160_30140 [Streptomyces calidiresistens]